METENDSHFWKEARACTHGEDHQRALILAALAERVEEPPKLRIGLLAQREIL